ncbi:MAG: DUF4214 domain-containing protein [Methylococcales bacterium]|nr:DUF4214 domain-containing protein [Methylococcales bacterium]
MATTAQKASILEMYTASFGRAADPVGFNFWVGQFDTAFPTATGADDAAKTTGLISLLSVAITEAPEYIALYPATQSNLEFVQAIYKNILNRVLPADDAGVVFWLDKLDTNAGTRADAIPAILEAVKAASTPEGLLDKALVENKTTVSQFFVDSFSGLSEVDALAKAKTAFDTVTSDVATVETAKTALGPPATGTAGTTFVLTTGDDSFIGTADNDTFDSADGTLKSADSLIDTTTTDADVANLTSLIYDSTAAPLIKNVETINVNATTNSVGLNLKSVSGAKTLNLNTTATSGTATVIEASSATAEIVAGDNISTLNVTTTATGTAGSLSVKAGKATSVTLTGGAKDDVVVIDTPADVKSLYLKGGTGADDFKVNLTGTIATGAAFEIANGTATAGEIEALTLNLSTGPSVLNLVDVDQVVGTATGDKVIILGDQDITFVGNPVAFNGTTVVSAIGAKTSAFHVETSSTANLSAAAFNVIDVIKPIVVSALTVHKDSVIKLSVANTNTVNFAGAATDTIKIDLGASQSNITIATATKVALTNVTADTTITTYNPIAASDTTVTGDKALTIGGSAITGKFDASALTGVLTGTFSSTADVIGGTGNDKLTITGAGTLDGGAGDDTLTTMTTVATKLTGGAGKDIFVIKKTGAVISDFVVADDTVHLSVTELIAASSKIIDGGAVAITTTNITTNIFKVKQITAATTIAAGDAIVGLSGEFADKAAMELAIEASGTHALTLTAPTASDDILILWNKTGGDAILSTYDVTNSAVTPVSTGTSTNFLTLTGVDSTTLTSADFSFVA